MAQAFPSAAGAAAKLDNAKCISFGDFASRGRVAE